MFVANPGNRQTPAETKKKHVLGKQTPRPPRPEKANAKKKNVRGGKGLTVKVTIKEKHARKPGHGKKRTRKRGLSWRQRRKPQETPSPTRNTRPTRRRSKLQNTASRVTYPSTQFLPTNSNHRPSKKDKRTKARHGQHQEKLRQEAKRALKRRHKGKKWCGKKIRQGTGPGGDHNKRGPTVLGEFDDQEGQNQGHSVTGWKADEDGGQCSIKETAPTSKASGGVFRPVTFTQPQTSVRVGCPGRKKGKGASHPEEETGEGNEKQRT